MVAGDLGVPGLSVPRHVVEEPRQDRDSVLVQPRPMVAETVRERTQNRNPAPAHLALTKVNKTILCNI